MAWGRNRLISDDDDVTGGPAGPAARDLRLGHGQRGLAAQQQGADLAEDALAAVAAMDQAVAVAGLAAALSFLTPTGLWRAYAHGGEGRLCPDLRRHSNHQNPQPPPLECPFFTTDGL